MGQQYSFFVTTAKGMEELLVEELKTLGIQGVEGKKAGASFQGTLEQAYQACLESRIANRVLLPLKTFTAPTPEKLYGGVKSIRWSDHLGPEKTMAVDVSSSRSEIQHTQFGALKTKDAIVDQLRSIHGSRPSVNVVQPDVRINVYLHENQATVSLDLSGDSLHKRGYREEGGGAPLKENLASAILMLAGWPKVAQAGGALVDAMCGSGTLPIEAAAIALRHAAGLKREYYGFLGWKQHQPAVWQKLRSQAQARYEKASAETKHLKIDGYDRDFRAVRVAIANVEHAGFRGKVHIEKRELEASAPLESRATGPAGIFVVNPPYGERMGEVEELIPLYRQIGDVMKQKFKGWEGYVFTGSPELAKNIGLKASRRFVLYNGPIECRLLKFELF
jgi:23S rRNA (guanine2445-N2)-methyltransferase / 23S rRNA (guanine2069-N7)-methyltransferase